MQDLWFLCSAYKIMLIDIYMKLCGDSLNHFQVTEWTRFCDRQTDAQGKNNTHLPTLKGGDIIRILAHAGGGILLLLQILSALASPSKGVCVGRGGGCCGGGGGGQYLEQNRFKNRHNWHARSNLGGGGGGGGKQEDHDGPISLT